MNKEQHKEDTYYIWIQQGVAVQRIGESKGIPKKKYLASLIEQETGDIYPEDVTWGVWSNVLEHLQQGGGYQTSRGYFFVTKETEGGELHDNE